MSCQSTRHWAGLNAARKPMRRNEGGGMKTPTLPEKTPLVLVDMQNDYCNARGVYPRNGLNCFDMDSVVPATVAAVTACKARAMPVIYLRMAWNTDARGFPIDAGLIIEQSRPFIR